MPTNSPFIPYVISKQFHGAIANYIPLAPPMGPQSILKAITFVWVIPPEMNDISSLIICNI